MESHTPAACISRENSRPKATNASPVLAFAMSIALSIVMRDVARPVIISMALIAPSAAMPPTIIVKTSSMFPIPATQFTTLVASSVRSVMTGARAVPSSAVAVCSSSVASRPSTSSGLALAHASYTPFSGPCVKTFSASSCFSASVVHMARLFVKFSAP